MHDDRLGFTDLPRRVTSVYADPVRNVGPEREVSVAPVLCAGESFAFVSGDVVTRRGAAE